MDTLNILQNMLIYFFLTVFDAPIHIKVALPIPIANV